MARIPEQGLRLAASCLLTVVMSASAARAEPVGLADRDGPPRAETEGQAPPREPDLGQQLDRSQGVIRPPGGVDPGMQVPPPDPGSQRTPVIPPPGSPGGDRTIEPK